MLTSFHLQNFKVWQDTGRINLAPLTVIFGADNAGQPSVPALRYRLFGGFIEALSAKLERNAAGQLELEATGYKLTCTMAPECQRFRERKGMT